MTRVSKSWLALREPADAAARAADLVEQLPPAEHWVIHDLGAGTGSMGRWLAPRLAGTQLWVLHDRDPDLLEAAAIGLPGVTVETRQSDVTQLDAHDVAGATLITASALLDLLTGDELARLVGVCAGAACPALLTLSVTGNVQLTPADPLDQRVVAAFNAHQRRRRLLGPDAVALATDEFRRLGWQVLVRPSPWQLGPQHGDLAAQWFAGWVDAACEQQPELAAAAADYRERRLAGPIAVEVDHADLLALPSGQAVSNRPDSA